MSTESILTVTAAVVSATVAVVQCIMQIRDRRRREEAIENDNVDKDDVGEIDEDKEDGVGKNFAKYSIDGSGEFTKGRLVHEVIRRYIERHDDITYEELQKAFPASARGVKNANGFWGCVNLLDDAVKLYNETGYQRHFLKKEDILMLPKAGQEIAVSSQWGIGNINQFIRCAKKHGFDIVESAIGGTL